MKPSNQRSFLERYHLLVLRAETFDAERHRIARSTRR
jgi:hypothetical protein